MMPYDGTSCIAHPTVAGVIIIVYSDSMIRTQISVDEELYERAKEVARRHGISLAELCRRSLVETLAREHHDKPWMAFSGILGGDAEDSQRVDEVVYGRGNP